ncbi:Hpt domain-containing protein [Jiella sp. MQZ9-1]|uniref:Hpt domain-containing protein n=1 Tax=Jiella flava TaxID=2816857 RepID=A0A939FWX5_9HYPH|nr:Hpt domain-containing protein [Jiella flava]MBO0663000.1 Hpt domain-containing protein [Jiella flava]MCD2471241.1 Hpt domain-containing protein [Jiella flava]
MAHAIKLECELETAATAGESGSCPSRCSPIDLVYLARQTAGDQALESEVLGLLVIQIERARPIIATALEEERARIAHSLKGAARNLGAFRLADAAEQLERTPGDLDAVAALVAELDDTAAFARELARR